MILITGANGQLGTELRYLLDERNVDYVAVDVAEMDITNAEMVEKVFAKVYIQYYRKYNKLLQNP